MEKVTPRPLEAFANKVTGAPRVGVFIAEKFIVCELGRIVNTLETDP